MRSGRAPHASAMESSPPETTSTPQPSRMIVRAIGAASFALIA
jgi:hypothetical protein